jgi:hypothetical protein
LLAALVIGLGAIPARAEGPILHEYVAPDEQEDVTLRTTTANGALPAALDTPSGLVSAPDVLAPVASSDVVYGGTATPGSSDSRYQIDRDTSRPDAVGYDDPFIPALTPYKRLYAYDYVDEAFELEVQDRRLVPLLVGAPGAGPGDDQFYANLVVDLQAGVPVRIPSVGPGARVLSATTRPPVRFELLRDGADNWFIRSAERQRVRLVMQLAIARAVFGSDYATVSTSELARSLPPLPAAVRAAAGPVIEQLGIAPGLRPGEVLAALVDYFRRFEPSTDRPSTAGADLYRDLVSSQKGVCRHRAYAFMVTALGLGIPTRFVRNEAHAWVEVYDGRLWHRVDLGGAAGQLDVSSDVQQAPAHVPPPDPYRWPEGSESGMQVGSRAAAAQPSGAPASPPAPSASSAEPTPAVEPAPVPDAALLPCELVLESSSTQVRRGAPLEVTGRVATEGEGCAGARIDVALRSESGRSFPLGSVPADEDGAFRGAVVVPFDLAVGDYRVELQSPGTARCGPGQLE